jgi:HME family heavy-metal exporter
MTAITRHIEAQIARLKVPVGYYLAIEGNYKEQQAAMTRIGILSLVSILLIFAILYSRYNSAVLSLIIMANVPLALVGAVFALRVSGGTLSLATRSASSPWPASAPATASSRSAITSISCCMKMRSSGAR